MSTDHAYSAGRVDRAGVVLAAALLLLLAAGHALSYAEIVATLPLATLPSRTTVSIVVVWFTISAMLLAFAGAVMACRPRGNAYPVQSRAVLLGIGAVMMFSGILAMVVSRGDPFWLQQVLLGALIGWLGWRARRSDAPVCGVEN
jgi:drug/metabolite transporter (DMT)-like permease